MARNEGLVHIGSDGSTSGDRIAAAGYRARKWNEIVGWGFDGRIERMIEWWRNSPTHAPIMLDGGLTEIGAGYRYRTGTRWGHYWVVEFARPAAGQATRPPTGSCEGEGKLVDMLEYMRGDGRGYMVRMKDGRQEKFRTKRKGDEEWLQLKNNQYEQLKHGGGYIWRGIDTSPGQGEYYIQQEEGTGWARWCPRHMAIGQEWKASVVHDVIFYSKQDCRETGNSSSGRATNRLKLVNKYESRIWNGQTIRDVIEVKTGTGETMYYARGYGLVAWESGWGSSAIAHELPAQEWDNEPETGCW